MAWQVSVNGVVDTSRTFKDYAEFNAALRSDVQQGRYAESDAIKLVKVTAPMPDVPAEEGSSEPIVQEVRLKFVRVVYDRRANHTTVMSFAVALGIVIGFIARSLL